MRRPWPWAVAAVALLVPSVRAIGHAAGALDPWLTANLPLVLDGPTAAVGAGWIIAYLLLNGSVAADVAVILQHAGVLTTAGLFLLVLGARMGASTIVVAMDALSRLSLRDDHERPASSLGVLSFVVTLSVYIPLTITALAILLTTRAKVDVVTRPEVQSVALDPWNVALALAGLVGIWASLALLDAGLRRADKERLRARIAPWLDNPWQAAAVGAVATALTASIAFSLGALVPLYREGILTRRQMTPYILGAGIGTFSDSLLVAALLGAWEAMAVLGVLMAAVTAVTVLVLLTYRAYTPLVNRVQDRILSSRLTLFATLTALVVAPLLLLLL